MKRMMTFWVVLFIIGSSSLIAAPLYNDPIFYEDFVTYDTAKWNKFTNSGTVEFSNGDLLITASIFGELCGNPDYSALSIGVGEKVAVKVTFDSPSYSPSSWLGFYISDRSSSVASYNDSNQVGVAFRTKDSAGNWSWGWYTDSIVNTAATSDNYQSIVADYGTGLERILEIERADGSIILNIYDGSWSLLGGYEVTDTFAPDTDLFPCIHVHAGISNFVGNDLTVASIPEPMTLCLFGCGCLMLIRKNLNI